MKMCAILSLLTLLIPASAAAEYWTTLERTSFSAFDLTSRGYELIAVTRSSRPIRDRVDQGTIYEQATDYAYMQKSNTIFLCPIQILNPEGVPQKASFSCYKLVAPFDMDKHAK